MRHFALCLALLVAVPALADESPPSDPIVQARYDQGKILYDAKQYDAALREFDACAEAEPNKARWQYNRGLALKKLKRDDEARAAFEKSLAIDPAYKASEISTKLSELGGTTSPPGGNSELPLFRILPPMAALVGFLALVVLFLKKRIDAVSSGGSPAAMPKHFTNAPERVKNVDGAIGTLATLMARVEHGLSLGEDDEARAFADRASQNLSHARALNQRAQRGEVDVAEPEQALLRAREAAAGAEARLKSLHGAAYDTAHGPREGCFFCARPLPTPQSRHPVNLKSAGSTAAVAACAVCARRCKTAEPPEVLMVPSQGSLKHWSAAPEFDPYAHRYTPPQGSAELPAWKATSPDFGGLAGVAGSAAFGVVAGAALGSLLDLDGARESGMAQLAAAEAARSAAASRERSWQDHS